MKNFLKVSAIIIAAIVGQQAVQPVSAAFWQWSKTSSSNATADPSINWSEGMSPSSINNSASAMMARAAEYRDDISGALTLGGTSTAYTLTTNQVLASVPTTGQMLAFVPNVTNGNAPVLVTDGGTSYALQSSPGVAIGAGTIVAGTPYRASFNGTAWILEAGYGNPYSVALGSFLISTVDTAPNSSFVLPYGQCISRTTYATYFAAVSTRFGACDGTTTFAVPDLRGRAFAGLDNMGGSAASRLTGYTSVGVAGGAETVTLARANLPNTSVTVAITDPGHTHTLPTGTAQTTQTGNNVNSNYALGAATSGSSFTGITSSFNLNGNVTQTTVGIVQPTFGVTYFLRII